MEASRRETKGRDCRRAGEGRKEGPLCQQLADIDIMCESALDFTRLAISLADMLNGSVSKFCAVGRSSGNCIY